MIPLTITPDLDRAPWTDCRDVDAAKFGTIDRIGRLPKGTQAGKSTVTVLVTLPDGSRVMGQTTLALMAAAVRALAAADEPTDRN